MDLEMMILDTIDTPMSVRSSSILEDDVNLSLQASTTKFVSNSGDRASRRRGLEAAIKEVYASTYNPAARGVQKEDNILWGGERMGVPHPAHSGEDEGIVNIIRSLQGLPSRRSSEGLRQGSGREDGGKDMLRPRHKNGRQELCQDLLPHKPEPETRRQQPAEIVSHSSGTVRLR